MLSADMWPGRPLGVLHADVLHNLLDKHHMAAARPGWPIALTTSRALHYPHHKNFMPKADVCVV
jgi:hypothetical protein